MKDNSNNRTYTDSFKENAVSKLLRPESQGLSATASKMGIASSTLFGWKKKYANQSSMKKTKNQSIDDWTPEQKLEVVFETRNMTENELGEYLRTNGLYLTDLEKLQEDSLSGFKSIGRPKLDPELTKLRKQKKILERDLIKKDKALAEYSARVILLKKSHEIWGESET
jgi:transposase